MGDADDSYDFSEVPRFVEMWRQGNDVVMGNRFRGEIKPGAMPWHHKYVGNPVLTSAASGMAGGTCVSCCCTHRTGFFFCRVRRLWCSPF
jgi:hypothetical protein